MTSPSQPRSGNRRGHSQLEKRGGPSPAAPAGRQGPAEAPLQEEALGWGRTRQPTGWQEEGGTPPPPRPPRNGNCHCPEACLFWKHLTKRLPRWLSGNTPAGEVRLRWDPWGGKVPCRRGRQPIPVLLKASLVAQTVKNLLQRRRPGFDP